MAATLRLTEQLLAHASVTPHDAGCQTVLADRLRAVGFDCETIESGPADFRVTNLWDKFKGSGDLALDGKGFSATKTLVWAGHTDVVPTGPSEHWSSPPFVPTHRDGKLYGRGASDMKTSLAAMVVACEEFLAATPQPRINIAFLLTSDEEGPANDGTVVVCKLLQARGEQLDWCNWRATPFTCWPPRWPSWWAPCGTTATTTFRPPAGRSATSTAARVPAT